MKNEKLRVNREAFAKYLYESNYALSKGINKSDAWVLTRLIIDFFQENLIQDHIIEIRGIGTFEKKMVKSTNKKIPYRYFDKIERKIKYKMFPKRICEKYYINFKTSESIKNMINENVLYEEDINFKKQLKEFWKGV